MMGDVYDQGILNYYIYKFFTRPTCSIIRSFCRGAWQTSLA